MSTKKDYCPHEPRTKNYKLSNSRRFICCENCYRQKITAHLTPEQLEKVAATKTTATAIVLAMKGNDPWWNKPWPTDNVIPDALPPLEWRTP